VALKPLYVAIQSMYLAHILHTATDYAVAFLALRKHLGHFAVKQNVVAGLNNYLLTDGSDRCFNATPTGYICTIWILQGELLNILKGAKPPLDNFSICISCTLAFVPREKWGPS